MANESTFSNFKIIDKKYQLKDKSLGQGSFGQIFLTQNIFSHQILACKMISKLKLAQKHAKDPKVNPRQYYKNFLMNQVNIWSKLKHQNIVTLQQFSQTKSNIYFFMELCNQGSLFDYIKNSKRHQLKTQIQIFSQIVNGVKYMHDNSICHKDLKPENILLHNGKVKITDFSFSQIMIDSLMRDQFIVGSSYYMSPQAYSGQSYSLKTDVWSLGVILYTLIYKQKLWRTANKSSASQWLQEREKKIKFKQQPVVPKWIKKLIKKMLQVHEVDRLSINQVQKVLKLGERLQIQQATKLKK